MIRKLIAIIGGILLGVGCYAQTTAVSATVTDSDGNNWANATWKIDFKPSTQFPNPAQYTLNGAALSNSTLHQSGAATSGGAISVTVYDSSQVTPTGSGWTLSVCPVANSGCSTYIFGTSGGSMNITSALNASITSPRFPCLNICYGYNTVEVSPTPSIGSIFYNTSSGPAQSCNQWTGSSWSGCGTGSSGTVSGTISPLCPPSNSTCVQVNQDSKFVIDATTNSSTLITCPDCNFTSADVGKAEFATSQGTGLGTGFLLWTTSVCPIGTITSVTNSTTANVSTPCTATSSGNVVFVWGHKDGTALANMTYGCNVMHTSTNKTFIWDDQPFMNTDQCASPMQTTVGAPGPFLSGDGFDASQSVFIVPPDFNYTACPAAPAACVGSTLRGASNLQFMGFGLQASLNANCSNANNKYFFETNPASSVLRGVDLGGICPGSTGMVGVQLNNFDEIYSEAGAQSVGQYACQMTAGLIHIQANDCRNDNVAAGWGFNMTGGNLLTYGNYLIAGLRITGGNVYSVDTTFVNAANSIAVEVGNGAQMTSIWDTIQNLQIDSGGTHYSQGTLYNNSILNNGSFISSGGGNKFAGAINGVSTGTFSGQGFLLGSIQGTLTASSTLGFYGFGQNTAIINGSTTVNNGIVMQSVPLSGSVFFLKVTAGTAASNTTGANNTVTLMKTHNGTTAATTVTCNLLTATSCIDASHFDTPVVGDAYSCQIQTSSGPPSNVTCQVAAM